MGKNDVAKLHNKNGDILWESPSDEDVSKSKSELEFNRYKQDYRKRALELAHKELEWWWINANENTKRRIGIIEHSRPSVKTLANDYYNWLISIPE